jgi:hypothetical protein
MKTVHGIIRGRTIELSEALDVAEGQEVEVQVTVVRTAKAGDEGFTRVAGALEDDREWEAIMEEVYFGRQLVRRSQMDEQ